MACSIFSLIYIHFSPPLAFLDFWLKSTESVQIKFFLNFPFAVDQIKKNQKENFQIQHAQPRKAETIWPVERVTEMI